MTVEVMLVVEHGYQSGGTGVLRSAELPQHVEGHQRVREAMNRLVQLSQPTELPIQKPMRSPRRT